MNRCCRFDQYQEILQLDVDSFVEHIASANDSYLNLPALRTLIVKHQQARDRIIDSIPRSINLGLFTVVTQTARKFLLEKHNAVAQRVLAFVARSAHAKATALFEAFEAITKRLGKFPSNIEELVELKGYMETVPQQVRQLTQGINVVRDAYNLTEQFLFKVPKVEFDLNWTVFGRPKKVYQLVRKVRFQLQQEKTRYHAEMKDQQARFERTILILHQEVAGFARYTDLTKVDIVADHVAKVKRKLADAAEQVKVFNNRETLFGQDVTPYDNLTTVQKMFEPYQLVWETTSNWVKWHKEWMSGVFSELDAQLVEQRHTECLKFSTRCVKQFEATANWGCHAIAKYVGFTV